MKRDLVQYLLSAGLLCVGLDAASETAIAAEPTATCQASNATQMSAPQWEAFGGASRSSGVSKGSGGGGGGGQTGC
jgi:hypothetical protein